MHSRTYSHNSGTCTGLTVHCKPVMLILVLVLVLASLVLVLVLVLVGLVLVLVLVLAGPVLDKSYSLIQHATRTLLY